MCVTENLQGYLPAAEDVQAELAKVQTIDDFFGKEGVVATLFASRPGQMLEGEMTEYLGYKPYEVAGRNSGNNRNGHYTKEVRPSILKSTVQVPSERTSEFETQIIRCYAGNTNELARFLQTFLDSRYGNGGGANFCTRLFL